MIMRQAEHSLTLYSERSPVGRVHSQDIVDCDGSTGVWRRQRGEHWRRFSKEHTGAHGHGLRDGGEVITPLNRTGLVDNSY